MVLVVSSRPDETSDAPVASSTRGGRGGETILRLPSPPQGPLLDPTTCPLSFTPRTMLYPPPSVPRSVIEPFSQRTACPFAGRLNECYNRVQTRVEVRPKEPVCSREATLVGLHEQY